MNVRGIVKSFEGFHNLKLEKEKKKKSRNDEKDRARKREKSTTVEKKLARIRTEQVWRWR